MGCDSEVSELRLCIDAKGEENKLCRLMSKFCGERLGTF